jgi:hypothetical protein
LSEISCAYCGRGFKRRTSRQTMCSAECRGKFQSDRNKRRSQDVLERFWSKVDKSGGPDGCWPWTASCSKDGYGRFRLGGKSLEAPAIAFELTFGWKPPEVDHRCRNRICCNPKDLRAATRKQNNENRGVQRNNSTGVRGVFRDGGKFRAQVRNHGKAIHVGMFSTLKEADAAVRAKRLELFSHNEIDRVCA